MLTLGQVYDDKNEFVILNEFLAYLVQSDAGSGPLADLIPKHQDQIVQEIKETANINVFQFKSSITLNLL